MNLNINRQTFIDKMSALRNITIEGDADEQAWVRALGEYFKDLTVDSTDDQVAAALAAAKQATNDDPRVGAYVAQALSDSWATINGTDLTPNKTVDIGPGYYMIADKQGDVTKYSLYQVLGTEESLNIKDKTEVSSVTKKVEKKAADGSKTWEFAADYEIDEEFNFQLEIPVKGLEAGKDYPITIHDMMDTTQMQAPTKDQITIYVKRLGETSKLATSAFEFSGAIQDNENCKPNCAFHISLNVAGISGIQDGDTLVVEYPSKLLPGAAYGTAAGNKNGVGLDYPGGHTPGNEVTVFTFQLIANKVDGSTPANPLPGAVFALSKKNEAGEYVQVALLGAELNEDGTPITNEDGTYVTGDMTQFTFDKLATGDYMLTEVQAPLVAGSTNRYNPVGPFYFEVVPQYETNNDGVATNITSVNIVEKSSDGTVLESKPLNPTINVTAGSVTSTIVNRLGTTLPETGGIGTTIFYIVGGLLVAGAVILLITKRRMNLSED